ncbi:hypothetical protein RUA4292_03889 [Ruegeria atlantica]|uniref:Uncharacterized protein n=1 Tax=Ruegeria atlantica TaxID=81569 RepID=A0A0N7LR32_9RHOB|nr:hypothetical protein RUA4292_03889 [Ruegeria atlantica]
MSMGMNMVPPAAVSLPFKPLADAKGLLDDSAKTCQHILYLLAKVDQ